MATHEVLTKRQQEDLNKAIVQYIKGKGEVVSSSIIEDLCVILGVDADQSEEVVPNYLEKKWTAVLRLQKRIHDLENELDDLKKEPKSPAFQEGMRFSSKDWIPSEVQRTINLLPTQTVNCLSLHPVLPILVAGCSDGSLIIWNLVSELTDIPKRMINAHTRGVTDMTWSSIPLDLASAYSKNENNAYLLATTSNDSTIKIWEGNSFNHVRTLSGHEHTVSSAVFSMSQPSVLYSASRDKSVKEWDILNGFCLNTFVGHSDWVRGIDCFSAAGHKDIVIPSKLTVPSSDFIVTCSNDQSVRLTHAKSGRGLALLLGHKHVVECVKILPRQYHKLLDEFLIKNSSIYPQIPKEIIQGLDSLYVFGFRYCLTGGRDNCVYLWLFPPISDSRHDGPSPSAFNNSKGWLLIEMTEHKSWVRSLDIHPSGRYIFSGSDDKTVKVWDLQTLSNSKILDSLRTLTGHQGFINAIDFATIRKPSVENGTSKTENNQDTIGTVNVEETSRCIFLSASMDHTIKIWQ